MMNRLQTLLLNFILRRYNMAAERDAAIESTMNMAAGRDAAVDPSTDPPAEEHGPAVDRIRTEVRTWTRTQCCSPRHKAS
jgi:hypothetical protein